MPERTGETPRIIDLTDVNLGTTSTRVHLVEFRSWLLCGTRPTSAVQVRRGRPDELTCRHCIRLAETGRFIDLDFEDVTLDELEWLMVKRGQTASTILNGLVRKAIREQSRSDRVMDAMTGEDSGPGK